MDADSGWRETVERYWQAMSPEEAEEFRAGALIALDEATRRRRLTPEELARLTALAEYVGDRLSRRTEPPLGTREAVLYGLLAGYQLGVGQA